MTVAHGLPGGIQAQGMSMRRRPRPGSLALGVGQLPVLRKRNDASDTCVVSVALSDGLALFLPACRRGHVTIVIQTTQNTTAKRCSSVKFIHDLDTQ